MKGLSDLDPANPPELLRFEHIDPDMLINVTEQCHRSRCSLQDEHEGPHAEIGPYHGMIYDVWGSDGVQVSKEALQVAHAINEARNEAMQALDDAYFLQAHLQNKHKDVTKEDDPILRMILDEYEYWPTTSHSLDTSGFEADTDKGLREELLEIFEDEE